MKLFRRLIFGLMIAIGFCEIAFSNIGSNGANQPGYVDSGMITFVFIPLSGTDPASVSIAGSMNSWMSDDPNMVMTRTNGMFILETELEPGKYGYKLIIDGDWIVDMEDYDNHLIPKPDFYMNDGFGGQNAGMIVK